MTWTTTSTGTDAKCEPCSDGDSSKASNGSETGLRESKRSEARPQQTASLLMPPNNGEGETVDEQPTGVIENRCALLREQKRQSRTILYALVVACFALGACAGAAFTAWIL